MPKRRLGTGALLSFVAYGALVAIAFYVSTASAVKETAERAVTFFAAPPPPPPPPPSSGGGEKPKTEHKVQKKIKKPDTIIQPKEIPQEKPKEAEPEPEKPEEPEDNGQQGGVEGGVVGGVEGGVVGGVVGGVIGGQLGGQLGGEVLPFGEGMTRPEQLEGHAPVYSRDALEARVQGVMLVKCVITVDGDLKNCRIIKPLPHMEAAVLDALKSWKMKPATFQGRPVAVDYVIPIRLVLPNR